MTIGTHGGASQKKPAEKFIDLTRTFLSTADPQVLAPNTTRLLIPISPGIISSSPIDTSFLCHLRLESSTQSPARQTRKAPEELRSLGQVQSKLTSLQGKFTSTRKSMLDYE